MKSEADDEMIKKSKAEAKPGRLNGEKVEGRRRDKETWRGKLNTIMKFTGVDETQARDHLGKW